jgi:acetyl esterase/lipase
MFHTNRNSCVLMALMITMLLTACSAPVTPQRDVMPTPIPSVSALAAKPTLALPTEANAPLPVIPSPSPPPVPSTTTREKFGTIGFVERDVVYCTTDNDALKLDIYSPIKPKRERAPMLLYFHGYDSQKGGVSPLIELLRAGYVVADVEFRFLPPHKMPEAVEDAKCAVRFLRAQANTFQIDADAVGAYGCSIGSYLAAMLGVTDEQVGPEGTGEYAAQSSRVQAVAAISGIYDWALLFDPTRGGAFFHLDDVQHLFGVNSLQDPLVKRIDVITWLDKDDAPFLIVHGDRDIYTPLNQAQTLYDKLKSIGASVDLLILKGGGHCLTPSESTEPSYRETVQKIVEFFDHTLK